MTKIDTKLNSILATSGEEKKVKIVVTGHDVEPQLGLKAVKGLDGIYFGELTKGQIEMLAQSQKIDTIQLDEENTIL